MPEPMMFPVGETERHQPSLWGSECSSEDENPGCSLEEERGGPGGMDVTGPL